MNLVTVMCLEPGSPAQPPQGEWNVTCYNPNVALAPRHIPDHPVMFISGEDRSDDLLPGL